tara:strand:- start:302 stop:640 length:339 start_codon:yes stop_codon:yes gene_type:complete
MIIKTEEYKINCSNPNKVEIIGSMRLPSPLSYENLFEPIKEQIELSTEKYQINLVKLDYLNSSGLTALARILILSRSLKKPIKVVANNNIPWQKKSLSSLEKLWDQIEIEFE